MSTDPTKPSNAACKNTCATRQFTSNRGAWVYGSLKELHALENTVEALNEEIQVLKIKINNLPTGVENLYQLKDCDDDLNTAESGTILVRDASGTEWVKSGLNRIAIGHGTDNTITSSPYTTAIGYEGTGNAHSLGINSIGAIAIGAETAVYPGVATANANAIAIGTSAATTGQSQRAIAIGFNAGQATQAISAIAIGYDAGKDFQGTGSIAIGPLAGRNSQASNCIAINAGIGALDNTVSGTCVVKPIRFDTAQTGAFTNFIPPTGFNLMAYNITTGEIITYSST